MKSLRTGSLGVRVRGSVGIAVTVWTNERGNESARTLLEQRSVEVNGRRGLKAETSGVKIVLILKAGTAAPSVRLVAGDYDRWFPRTLGLAGQRFRVVNVDQAERLPSHAGDFDAILVTGSPRSVTELAPWMLRTCEFLRNAADRQVPILGVCFGHQLLGHAYGARVRRSPLGREIGTVTCELTSEGREDPLFEGVPGRFQVQATHEDVVEEAPPAMELLASNAHTRNQAFRVGRNVRAVQFHPEVDPPTMKALIDARLEKLEAEAVARGEDPSMRMRALYAGIRPTPFGRRILENFLRHFA
jgi:GMP synthase (glutamine-hydrolysing)